MIIALIMVKEDWNAPKGCQRKKLVVVAHQIAVYLDLIPRVNGSRRFTLSESLSGAPALRVVVCVP